MFSQLSYEDSGPDGSPELNIVTPVPFGKDMKVKCTSYDGVRLCAGAVTILLQLKIEGRELGFFFRSQQEDWGCVRRCQQEDWGCQTDS